MFESQTAQIAFDAPKELAGDLLQMLKSEPDSELKVNFLATQQWKDEVVVLQSPTGSSQVRIEPGRALLSTTYFDEFRQDNSWE